MCQVDTSQHTHCLSAREWWILKVNSRTMLMKSPKRSSCGHLLTRSLIVSGNLNDGVCQELDSSFLFLGAWLLAKWGSLFQIGVSLFRETESALFTGLSKYSSILQCNYCIMSKITCCISYLSATYLEAFILGYQFI